MFTLKQIQEAHKKVKSGADFPKFVQDLKLLGVTHYDNLVENGQLYFTVITTLKLKATLNIQYLL